MPCLKNFLFVFFILSSRLVLPAHHESLCAGIDVKTEVPVLRFLDPTLDPARNGSLHHPSFASFFRLLPQLTASSGVISIPLVIRTGREEDQLLSFFEIIKTRQREQQPFSFSLFYDGSFFITVDQPKEAFPTPTILLGNYCLYAGDSIEQPTLFRIGDPMQNHHHLTQMHMPHPAIGHPTVIAQPPAHALVAQWSSSDKTKNGGKKSLPIAARPIPDVQRTATSANVEQIPSPSAAPCVSRQPTIAGLSFDEFPPLPIPPKRSIAATQHRPVAPAPLSCVHHPAASATPMSPPAAEQRFMVRLPDRPARVHSHNPHPTHLSESESEEEQGTTTPSADGPSRSFLRKQKRRERQDEWNHFLTTFCTGNAGDAIIAQPRAFLDTTPVQTTSPEQRAADRMVRGAIRHASAQITACDGWTHKIVRRATAAAITQQTDFYLKLAHFYLIQRNDPMQALAFYQRLNLEKLLSESVVDCVYLTEILSKLRSEMHSDLSDVEPVVKRRAKQLFFQHRETAKPYLLVKLCRFLINDGTDPDFWSYVNYGCFQNDFDCITISLRHEIERHASDKNYCHRFAEEELCPHERALQFLAKHPHRTGRSLRAWQLYVVSWLTPCAHPASGALGVECVGVEKNIRLVEKKGYISPEEIAEIRRLQRHLQQQLSLGNEDTPCVLPASELFPTPQENFIAGLDCWNRFCALDKISESVRARAFFAKAQEQLASWQSSSELEAHIAKLIHLHLMTETTKEYYLNPDEYHFVLAFAENTTLAETDEVKRFRGIAYRCLFIHHGKLAPLQDENYDEHQQKRKEYLEKGLLLKSPDCVSLKVGQEKQRERKEKERETPEHSSLALRLQSSSRCFLWGDLEPEFHFCLNKLQQVEDIQTVEAITAGQEWTCAVEKLLKNTKKTDLFFVLELLAQKKSSLTYNYLPILKVLRGLLLQPSKDISLAQKQALLECIYCLVREFEPTFNALPKGSIKAVTSARRQQEKILRALLESSPCAAASSMTAAQAFDKARPLFKKS